LLFERPIQAVAFALDYQRDLKRLSVVEEVDLSARVGIHMGDVVVWENDVADIARGAKPLEVEGLAKPVAARLAALAQSGQILMSGVVAAIARRAHGDLRTGETHAHWKAHGRYRLKGVPEPLDVFEIGEPPVARFRTPPSQGTARRLSPWWRRPWVVATALLVASVGVALWMGAHDKATMAFAARDWVVVGDLQNQTANKRLDASVATALRIGLQQSRYVNVIPEMRIKQTLDQMKKPQGTRLDREIGAEVALREHAKALVLPAVINYGGGYRVIVELVDPQTQRTVTSTSIDVDRSDAMVTAIGVLVHRLRDKLGESLAQIRSSSVPLAQATTSNLEALRTYSLAERARGRGDIHLSLSLLNRAIELDPSFASAYALVGANYLTLGQVKLAQDAIDTALKHSDRLSYLERAKLQAQKMTSYMSPVDAMNAWKSMADLYPDYAAAPHNVGMYFAAYLNDCTSALPYLRHAADLPQAQRGASLYAVAVCELTLGDADKAVTEFKRAGAAGFGDRLLGLTDGYVVLRQYDKATAYLRSVPLTAENTVTMAERRALVAADQGDLAAAASYLRQGLHALGSSNSTGWPLRLDLVGILWAGDESAEALAQTRTDLHSLLAMEKSEHEHLPLDYPTLVAAYSRWAARLGDIALAERGIAAVNQASGNLQDYPNRAQLVAVAEAELKLRTGFPEAAVHVASAADSHPLWELLDVLARANAAAKRPNAAAAFQRALQARSQAIGEIYENNLGICTRAVQWNLDNLEAALTLGHSDPTAARKLADEFLRNWPLASPDLPAVKEARRILAKPSTSPVSEHED
jgi:putative peptide modification system cyclase